MTYGSVIFLWVRKAIITAIPAHVFKWPLNTRDFIFCFRAIFQKNGWVAE